MCPLGCFAPNRRYEIVAFDAAVARNQRSSARLGSVKLPSPAIGMALTADGATIIASHGSTLTFSDTAKIHLGNVAIQARPLLQAPGASFSSWRTAPCCCSRTTQQVCSKYSIWPA